MKDTMEQLPTLVAERFVALSKLLPLTKTERVQAKILSMPHWRRAP